MTIVQNITIWSAGMVITRERPHHNFGYVHVEIRERPHHTSDECPEHHDYPPHSSIAVTHAPAWSIGTGKSQ